VGIGDRGGVDGDASCVVRGVYGNGCGRGGESPFEFGIWLGV
jgi:hypothetical protein